MQSSESIGSCSLDSAYDNIDKKLADYRSVSEKSLKSLSLCTNELGDRAINGHKMPSYVGISCVISGYTNFSRFCASTRSGHSRGNSPTLHLSNTSYDLNCKQNVETCEDLQFASKQDNQSVDGDQLDCAVQYTQPEMEEKSLVQQRIESLYGSSFAAGWQKSRSRQKTKNGNDTNGFKQRSPSCPPTHSLNGTHKATSLPVFKHIDETFLNKLQRCESLNSPEHIEHAPVPMCISTTKETNDGHWFLKELHTAADGINKSIMSIETYVNQNCDKLSDEIQGRIRSAIGKANLLLTKKFAQFEELCNKNIEQNVDDEFQTTTDDLAGFWEMVLLQVDNVKQSFKEIENLQRNNWIEPETKKIENHIIVPKSKLTKRSITSPKSSPVKSSNSSQSSPSSSSNSNRDETRRNRLKEAKLKQARLKAAKSENDDIIIFTSKDVAGH